MALGDPNLFLGRGLWACIALIIIVIIFWLYKKSKKPENQGAY